MKFKILNFLFSKKILLKKYKKEEKTDVYSVVEFDAKYSQITIH